MARASCGRGGRGPARWWAAAVACAALLSGGGCGDRALRGAADQAAAAIDGDLVAMREALGRMTSRIAEAAAHPERQDRSRPVDAADGGPFHVFNGGEFYAKEPGGCAFYISPGGPPSEALKREIAAMLPYEPFLADAYQEARHPRMVFYAETSPASVGMLFPYEDIVSIYPPHLDLGAFEWIQRGARAAGGAAWSPAPFTALHAGWVVDISQAALVDGAVRGVGVLNVRLAELFERHLRDRPQRLLLVGPDLALVAANRPARAALPLRVLEDFDDLRKHRENTFVPERYRLSDPGQDPGVQELGRRLLAGERAFRVRVGGQERRCVVSPIPEVRFWVVGVE